MRPYVFAAAVILLAACSGSKSEQKDTNTPPGAPPTSPESGAAPGASSMTCPADVPGTTVRTEDTPDGVAMIFTTSDTAQVPMLQQSVSHFAHSISQGGMSQGEDVRTADPGSEPSSGMEEMEPRDGEGDQMHEGMGMPQSRTNVVPLDNGARLELMPTDPSMLEDLREDAKRNAQAMQDGSCPMMKHGG